jgi:hypothetical protein
MKRNGENVMEGKKSLARLELSDTVKQVREAQFQAECEDL